MEENLPHGLSQRASLQGNIPAVPSQTGQGRIRFCTQSCCWLPKRACQSFYQSFCSLQMMSPLKSCFGQTLVKMWYCFNQNILVDLNGECEHYKTIYSHFKLHVCRSDNNQVTYEEPAYSLVQHSESFVMK